MDLRIYDDVPWVLFAGGRHGLNHSNMCMLLFNEMIICTVIYIIL